MRELKLQLKIWAFASLSALLLLALLYEPHPDGIVFGNRMVLKYTMEPRWDFMPIMEEKKEAIGLLADDGCVIGDPLYYYQTIVTPGGPTWIMFTCLTPKASVWPVGLGINAGN